MSLQGFKEFENGSCTRNTPSLDPHSSTDDIVVAVCALTLAIDGLLIGFVISNRHYPPLSAKQPWLHLAQYIGGVFWVFGNFLIGDNIYLPQVQRYGAYCFFRRYWIAYLFGFFLWMSCMIIRFLRLYLVIVLHKIPWKIPICLLLFELPVLFVAIIGFFLPMDSSCLYVVGDPLNPERQVVLCSANTYGAYFTSSLHIIYFLISVAFVIGLRNIRTSFNEYKELSFQIIFGSVLYVSLIALSLLHVDVTLAGRSAIALLFTFVVTVVQFIPLAHPIYMTFFKREEYLNAFRMQLELDSKNQIANSLSTRTKGKEVVFQMGSSFNLEPRVESLADS